VAHAGGQVAKADAHTGRLEGPRWGVGASPVFDETPIYSWASDPTLCPIEKATEIGQFQPLATF